MNINDRFQQIIKAQGSRSIIQTIDEWSELVDDVVDRYTSTIDDYEDELTVRELLTEAESQLGDDPNWEYFGQQLSDADTKLKDFLAQGPRVKDTGPWWRRQIPPCASSDFARETSTKYGVQIKTIN